MTREPDFDELIGAETSDAERERLRLAHELLVQAGPPPELTPQLRKAPGFGSGLGSGFGMVHLPQRTVVKRRPLLLLAATLSVAAVFAAGYAVADHRGGSTSAAPLTLALKGTSFAPHASARLEVWHARDGNWPMTLSVVGLPKLPGGSTYEVYLVRNGKPWGSCGTFRVATSSGPVTVSLNAPYLLHKGDSWIVTRAARSGIEPGPTVLRPIPA